MSVDILYKTALGRASLLVGEKIGLIKLAAAYLHTRHSRCLIASTIRNNNIDMSVYPDEEYGSFSDFFKRRKEVSVNAEEGSLVSPCDGLLSAYNISSDLILPIKGSHYRLTDLYPGEDISEYHNGLCLVFRLEASDYHHFCYVDDCYRHQTHFLEGRLHSVQPIALEKEPVFRLNRRWWTVLDTKHFGRVIQTEIGAMMVGGVTYVHDEGDVKKGDEMGNFELWGSTITLLIKEDVKNKLVFEDKLKEIYDHEVRVSYGEKVAMNK